MGWSSKLFGLDKANEPVERWTLRGGGGFEKRIERIRNKQRRASKGSV